MSTIASFERMESKVRYYSTQCQSIFSRSQGAFVYDDQGRRYIDFFLGAGALNYGHNDPAMKNALLEYVNGDGIVHSLDFYTEAKFRFVDKLDRSILRPRQLDYKVQFTGPTGTNAVEAAMKLARKITSRSTIAAFTNAFHGVSLGSLAATAVQGNRAVAGVQLDQVIRLPYEGFLGGGEIDYIEKMLTSEGSGISRPAAVLLETVQGEGGLNKLSDSFVRRLFKLTKQLGVLTIVDDIQAGCGRTGRFFSFERFGVSPDIVCLSKSISGFGLPMALVLMKPEHDQWNPGEHNGTFRGNNLAFVTGAVALERWESAPFLDRLEANVAYMDARLDDLSQRFAMANVMRKGRGLFVGLELHDGELAKRARCAALERGLLIETCGPSGSVLKILAPLNVERSTLDEGLDMLAGALQDVTAKVACGAAN